MNPRICLVRHDPPASYGDCIRACIGTLLDRDDVPHVFDGRPHLEAWRELRAWLRSFNKTISLFPIDDHKEFMRELNPGTVYMLLASTGKGDHAVLAESGETIHDPAWYKTPIVGPHSSINAYIVCILGDTV